jgi:hypothetical protein
MNIHYDNQRVISYKLWAVASIAGLDRMKPGQFMKLGVVSVQKPMPLIKQDIQEDEEPEKRRNPKRSSFWD